MNRFLTDIKDIVPENTLFAKMFDQDLVEQYGQYYDRFITVKRMNR